MSLMTPRITGEAVSIPTISSAPSTGMPASRNDDSCREKAMMTAGLTVLPMLNIGFAVRTRDRRTDVAVAASDPSGVSGPGAVASVGLGVLRSGLRVGAVVALFIPA